MNTILERLDKIEKDLESLTNHGFKHSGKNKKTDKSDNDDITELKKIVGV